MARHRLGTVITFTGHHIDHTTTVSFVLSVVREAVLAAATFNSCKGRIFHDAHHIGIGASVRVIYPPNIYQPRRRVSDFLYHSPPNIVWGEAIPKQCSKCFALGGKEWKFRASDTPSHRILNTTVELQCVNPYCFFEWTFRNRGGEIVCHDGFSAWAEYVLE